MNTKHVSEGFFARRQALTLEHGLSLAAGKAVGLHHLLRLGEGDDDRDAIPFGLCHLQRAIRRAQPFPWSRSRARRACAGVLPTWGVSVGKRACLVPPGWVGPPDFFSTSPSSFSAPNGIRLE